jgi:hypothetical protein
MATHIGDLTVEEFKQILRKTIIEVLQELRNQINDEDNLEFKPELAERLRDYLRDKPTTGRTLEEVAKDLDIDL